MRLSILSAVCLPLAALGWAPCGRAAFAAEKDRPAPVTAQLARAGRAVVPVVTAPGASQRVRRIAKTLADYLGEISGGTFTIETGDGLAGIAVGLPEDFPRLGLGKLRDS